jgi:hypothetical protein
MRDFKGIKRQRGRNRSGGGGGGGGKPQQNANRAFDSNGPEGVKVRGAAQHVYEKYQQLARDAQTSGDRVLAENYLQHAEHYFRLMRAMQPQRPLAEIIGRDQFVSGYDIDFEDEGGDPGEGDAEAEAGESAPAAFERPARPEPRRDDYRPAEGRRDDQPRSDRFQTDRRQGDRPFQERQGGDRFRDDRAARGDRPAFNRDDRRPRGERIERDPLGVVEPESTPLTLAGGGAEAGPMLRADDGDLSHAPAFLQVRPAEPRAAEGARPLRRRRVAAPADGDETPPEIPDSDEG